MPNAMHFKKSKSSSKGKSASSRIKNKSGGAAEMKQDRLEKAAVSSKGRMHQPKGANNPQHKRAGHMAKRQRNASDSKSEAMSDMEF